MGYTEIPWLKITNRMVWIYGIMTCLVLFHRPDFINLTVCCVAYYMLANISSVSQNHFRWLVVGIVLSLLYDMLWFSIKQFEYDSD